MMIEAFIRLGMPMVFGGLNEGRIIEQISDIHNKRGNKFFEHIIIVEIKEDEFVVHPITIWGDYRKPTPRSKKEKFFADGTKAIASPFVLSSGGNPTKPQGYYCLPVYFFYDIQAKNFSQNKEAVFSFLDSRLKKTMMTNYKENLIQRIATELQIVFSREETDTKEKYMGLIILADVEGDDRYSLVTGEELKGDFSLKKLAPSYIETDKVIAANLAKILDCFWLSKAEEGAEKGRVKEGDCFICQERGPLVSAYNKANFWLTTTWKAPLPIHKTDKELVDGIALCSRCYGSLTYGANIFKKLTRTFDNWLTKELFAPHCSPIARSFSSQNTENIHGSILALPLLDSYFEDEYAKEKYVSAINMLLSEDGTKEVDLHLKTISGIEMGLPGALTKDNIRLSILYYTGDTSKSDVHLLASIEDVLPSTARRLIRIMDKVQKYVMNIYREFPYAMSEGQQAYLQSRYGSFPYVLCYAYGYVYLWSSLADAFHHKPLGQRRFVVNSYYRFNEISKDLDNNKALLRDEAVFYVTYTYFLSMYSKEICTNMGGVKMRDWNELLSITFETPLQDITLNGVEEIGFFIGSLVRRFSNQYWHVTKTGDRGKDFIKHRVMTFGSILSPDTIWKRILTRVEEYIRLLDMRVEDDIKQRFAMASVLFTQNREEIMKDKEGFMAAFWAGYALYSTRKEQTQ